MFADLLSDMRSLKQIQENVVVYKERTLSKLTGGLKFTMDPMGYNSPRSAWGGRPHRRLFQFVHAKQ